MTYSDRQKYTSLIRDKFNEIKALKKDIKMALQNNDRSKYTFLVNIVYNKISVIETNIVNLRKELENAS